MSACLFDADNRCGPHQEYKDELCVCEAGFTLDGSSCIEVAKTPTDAGGEPDTDGGSEADTDTGHGYTGQQEPCSSDADCASFDASLCNVIGGYCIVPNCTEDSCDAGWTCVDLSKYLAGLPTACILDADVPK